MYRMEKAVTMTVTMRVMTSTMMVFRRSMRGKKKRLVQQHCEDALAAGYFLLAGNGLRGGAAIFLQFIMQRFQTNPENLGGSSLVVAGSLQRFQNQHFLGFFHRRAYAQANCIRIVGCRAQRSLSKPRGQMLGLDHARIADDDRPLDHIAQLTHVARP